MIKSFKQFLAEEVKYDQNFSAYRQAILDKYDYDIKDFHQEMEGGSGDDVKIMDFPLAQILKGIAVELEHGEDDVQRAIEISLDHLAEDPTYYDYNPIENPPEENKKEIIDLNS